MIKRKRTQRPSTIYKTYT